MIVNTEGANAVVGNPLGHGYAGNPHAHGRKPHRAIGGSVVGGRAY